VVANLLGTVIGILGGLGGVGMSALSITIGAAGVIFDIPGSEVCFTFALRLFGLALLGALGGYVGFYKPTLGIVMQLIAAVWGLFVSLVLWLLPFSLFTIGAVTMAISTKKQRSILRNQKQKSAIQSYWQ
jgi:hypothetical protein